MLGFEKITTASRGLVALACFLVLPALVQAQTWQGDAGNGGVTVQNPVPNNFNIQPPQNRTAQLPPGNVSQRPFGTPITAESLPQPVELAANPAPLPVANTGGESGDSDGDGGDEKQWEEGAHHFIETCKAAIAGNRQAQQSLAADYLMPILAIIVVMFLARWIGNYVQRMVSRVVTKQVDPTIGRFAGKLAKFAIMTIAFMGVLGYFNVETTSLAALVAALGFAVGMALQGTLGSFASGIALLIFRPFNAGDYIVVDGVEGIVYAIELFTTTIDTLDNRRIIVPNESVFGNRIENWTHNDKRRADVLVGVSYDADTKQTRQVLLSAIAEINGALSEPAPQVYLSELNASSVDWSCRIWCRPEDYLAVRERVMESVKQSLDRNGIGIPYPQLDLHVVSPAMQQKRAA